MTKMITMGFVWGEWGKVVSAIERSKQNPLTLPSICTEPSHITLQSLLYFPRYGQDRQQLWKMVKGRSLNKYVWKVLWFLGSALPLIVIYLYTMFYLNAKSSFKVICRTRYWTGGQSGDYMLPSLGITTST